MKTTGKKEQTVANSNVLEDLELPQKLMNQYEAAKEGGVAFEGALSNWSNYPEQLAIAVKAMGCLDGLIESGIRWAIDKHGVPGNRCLCDTISSLLTAQLAVRRIVNAGVKKYTKKLK